MARDHPAGSWSRCRPWVAASAMPACFCRIRFEQNSWPQNFPVCDSSSVCGGRVDLAPAVERNVEYTVERVMIMETVQIVLDKELLQATDRAARRTKRNRSALVRDALREHLRRLETSALEERDRLGYSAQGAAITDSRVWEEEAAWPRE